MDKELERKFRIFEQQIIQIQEQIQLVEQAVSDMEKVSLGINDLKGKTGQEIFAPIGKGIYIKAQLLSEELLVDVGEKNFVNRDIDGTNKMILEQKDKLEEIQKQLQEELGKINEELTQVFMEHQKMHSSENCGCSDDECDCDDKCGCDDECECSEDKCGCGH